MVRFVAKHLDLRLDYTLMSEIALLDRENTYLRATLATDVTPRRILRPNSHVLSEADAAKTNFSSVSTFSSALDIFLHATV